MLNDKRHDWDSPRPLVRKVHLCWYREWLMFTMLIVSMLLMILISMINLVENGWDGDLKTFYVSQFQSCLNVHSMFMILMISMMLNRMNKMVGNVLDGLLTLKDFPGKPPHQKGPSMLKIFSPRPPWRTKTNRTRWIFQENAQLISSSREEVTSSRDARPAPPRP